ncbi:pyrroline-5-carboxylate reductase [Novipirellula artificiosorum]|uniref:Pyrroline-5-carboxylate reductase n=1 Tax=Novipirellula artificiosorum TaxID=2528016 RepID=A0A5C6E021_9BACT|nr:pyrroline-5-carboxylate reductase [Novipirellula artificiosorum]TWU41051.1 Pyrroline-5-carboxylate reductase [Novipirellula artificiosorum]
MEYQRLVVVGGGQMGRALLCGMLDNGVIPESAAQVVEPSKTSRNWWQENRPKVHVTEDLKTAIPSADLVLLAVKPAMISKVAKQSPNAWDGKLVISIAAGIRMNTLCDLICHNRIIRVMPNTPCLVGEGASAYCCGQSVTSEDRSWIDSALGSVGMAVEVDEGQMDAVTGLSGSGPAYVCLMIEGLADGGVFAGLPRDLATKLATQTVLGTAKMIAETGRHPAELKDAVASPGGTTIAGLRSLEQNRLRAGLMDAVIASAERSRELG